MFAIIQRKLKENMKDAKIYKAFQYPTQDRFLKIYTAFEQCTSLKEWLESQYEDLYHSPTSFYYRLLMYFGFDWDRLNCELEECKELIDANIFFKSSIFVETSEIIRVHSMSQAIRAQYLGAQKRLHISKNLLANQSLEGVMKAYAKAIKKHYQDYHGELNGLGKILGYRVAILDRVCRFDAEGNFRRFLEIPLTYEERGALFDQVKLILEATSYVELAQKMGYEEAWRFQRGAKIFLECKDLQEWFGRGFYALQMRAIDFFLKLCEILFDERERAWEECKAYKNIARRCEKFDGVMYVQIEKDASDFANFFSKEEILTLCQLREIELDRRIFCEKTQNEVYAISQKMASHHFVRNDGRLPIWGEISGYKIMLYGKEYEIKIDEKMLKDNQI